MKTHKIKLLHFFCDDVLSGEKRFEIRLNDRDYQKGDHIRFIPYDSRDRNFTHPIENKKYEITFVLSGWGLQNGYVAFGIKEIVYMNNKKPKKKISLLKAHTNYSRFKNMSIDEMAIALASIAGIPSPCDLCENSVDDDICLRDDDFCCDINHRKSLMRRWLESEATEQNE